jgi:hypothetical protein
MDRTVCRNEVCTSGSKCLKATEPDSLMHRGRSVEVCTGLVQLAQIMFVFGPRSSDNNHTLHRTFRAFSGHYFSQGKSYSYLRSSYARDTVTKLRSSTERCDATFALRIAQPVWVCARKFTGIPRSVLQTSN